MPLLQPGTLRAVSSELETVGSEARKLLSELTNEELLHRPARGGWSVAECIEHLAKTTEAFLPLLEEAVRDLPSGGPGAGRTYRLGVTGTVLAWLLEPPVRMKTKTSPRFQPGEIEEPARVIERFLRGQARLGQFCHRADGMPLEGAMIVSPINASVRYSVYAALRILAAHQRRHLFQAHRVKGEVSRG